MGSEQNAEGCGACTVTAEGQSERRRVYEVGDGTVLIDGFFLPDTRHGRKDLCKWEKRRDELLDVVWPLLKGRRFALDVGAYVGVWADKLSVLFDRVFAYEPIDLNYECLVKNAPAAVTFKLAVGDKPKAVNMGLHGAHFGHVGGDEQEALMIPLDMLSSLDIDFIKIDVDGSEPQVLVGGERVITEQKPVICIEAKDNRTEIGNILRSYGYERVYHVSPDEIWISK
jgi:FkbM family methyltransferase